MSHISLHQRRPLYNLANDPFGGLSELFRIIIVSRVKTPIAIGYIAYPSDIAIQADYLAFCSRDQIISSSTLACARNLLANCRRAHLSFAVPHSHALFPVFASHRMRTRGALALRSPISGKYARDGRRCPVEPPP
eukprot:4691711-Pleurochrysis_carterae.AAC.1